MTTKTFILLILITLKSFAQEQINITFNTPLNIIIKSAKQTDGSIVALKYKALEANINTKYGKFSIVLIDHNKNNTFNDYYKAPAKNTSDLIYFTNYQENNIVFKNWQKRKLQFNQAIAINGITFRLKNLTKVSSTKYTATLVKEKIDFIEIVKNKNGAVIDSLPKLFLTEKKLKYNIRDFLDTDKFLYLSFYDGNMGYIDFPTNYQKLNSLRKLKLNVFHLGIFKGSKYISETGKSYKVNDLHLVKFKNKEQLIKLGCNDTYPLGILFNDKGKVVKFNISVEELKKFLTLQIKY